MTDQNSQFFAILTAVGEAKQANANALGVPWSFSQMAVGDANGTEPTPLRTQTSLINERRRAPLNQINIDPNNANIIIVEQVIPPDVGGWWIREIGLYDPDGDLVAVANCAPSFKPLLSQGTGKTQVVRLNIIVTSTANVQLKVDPAVVLATREYVDSAIISAINKQDSKRSVMVATTASIVLAGAQTIDGITLPAGARVLVKDQVAGKDNGIYLTAAGAWVRAEDADASIEVTPGLFVNVEQGALNADTVWQLITDAPIVLGTTALVFERALGPTGLVAGTYRQVKVNRYGQVEEGSNPNTLAGFGIMDAFTKTQITLALEGKADKSTTLAGYGILNAYTKPEVDAMMSRVVSLPAISGAASAKAGVNVTLTASASSLLVSGSIASFTWTLPDGTVSTTAATSGSASKTVTAKGSLGTTYVVSVFATDSAGNKSAVATKAITITDHTAPTVPTTVTVGTVYQTTSNNPLSASGSTASDGATLSYSITQSGPVALTFSKTSGITEGEVVTFSTPAVAVDTTVTVNVFAVDSMGGQSAAKTISVLVRAVPDTPGVPFGGGYYTGRKMENGILYALVTAPKASGEILAGLTFDGAAAWIAGRNINGLTDWRLPTHNEAEMQYRNLKPNSTQNAKTSNSPYYELNGVNSESVPVGEQYTYTNPTTTVADAFKAGGAEAFSTTANYWTSTRDGHYAGISYYLRNFSSGGFTSNNGNFAVRAVRLVAI